MSEKTRVLRARRGSPEKKSVSPRYGWVSNPHRCKGELTTDILEVLKKIGYGLALTVGKDGFVQAIAGFAWTS